MNIQRQRGFSLSSVSSLDWLSMAVVQKRGNMLESAGRAMQEINVIMPVPSDGIEEAMQRSFMHAGVVKSTVQAGAPQPRCFSA